MKHPEHVSSITLANHLAYEMVRRSLPCCVLVCCVRLTACEQRTSRLVWLQPAA